MAVLPGQKKSGCNNKLAVRQGSTVLQNILDSVGIALLLYLLFLFVSMVTVELPRPFLRIMEFLNKLIHLF